MNLTFLSIGHYNGMAVAYFLDQPSKSVFMFRVVDMTGGTAMPMNNAPSFSDAHPPVGFAPPVVPTPPADMQYPDKPIRSIIPPEFGGMGEVDGHVVKRQTGA